MKHRGDNNGDGSNTTDERVRVAVVQLAYHAAFRSGGRGYLTEPLGEETLPLTQAHGDGDELRALRERVRAQYVAQLSLKLQAIVEECLRWQVRIVVFPEYAIPAECLEALARASGDMVVVAGTHMVERQAGRPDPYGKLGMPKQALPPLRTAVSPVLHDGKLLALVPKIHPSTDGREQKALRPGKNWKLISLPKGLPSPLAVSVCIDFIDQSPEVKQEQRDQVEEVRWWAVPSLTTTTKDFDFEGHRLACRMKQPVLYANIYAPKGGSGVYVDERDDANALIPLRLSAGDEGVIVADVSFARRGPGKSTGYREVYPVRRVAAASFVHRALPADAAYHSWLTELATIIDDDSRDEESRLEAIEGHVALLNQPPLRGAWTENAPNARRHRLAHLRQTIHDMDDLREVAALTREVVMPAEVLPLAALQAALAAGALPVVQAMRQPSASDPAEANALIDGEVQLQRRSQQPTLTEAAAATWKTIADAVAGSPLQRVPRQELTSRLEFYAGEVAEGYEADFAKAKATFDEEHFSAVVVQLDEMLSGVQRQIDVDEHNREALKWRSRLRLLKAAALLNSDGPEAAREWAQGLRADDLPTASLPMLAHLRGVLGDAAEANTIIQQLEDAELPESLRKHAARAAQHVSIAAGNMPTKLLDDSSILIDAAHMALRQGRYQQAFDLACKGKSLGHKSRLLDMMALSCVIHALHNTIFEVVGWVEPLALGTRSSVIDTIEEWLVETASWPADPALPARHAQLLKQTRLTYFSDILDIREPDTTDAALLDKLAEALALAKDSRLEEALGVFDGVPDPTNSVWLHKLRRIDLVAFAGESALALEQLQTLAKEYPNRAPIEYTLADALLRADRGNDPDDKMVKEALAYAEHAATLVPASGYRAMHAECLIRLGQHQQAWDVLQPERDRGGWRIRGRLAMLADTVNPAEAPSLWLRYAEARPGEAPTLGYLTALRVSGCVKEAAEKAWEAYQQQADEWSARGLYSCARAQWVDHVLSLGAQDRVREIAAKLHRRFGDTPLGQRFLLDLRMTMGEDLPDAPVDYAALADAGVLKRFSTAGLLPALWEQYAQSEAIEQYYANGGLDLVALADVATTTVPALVDEMLTSSRSSGDGRRIVSYADFALASHTQPILELLLGEAELLFICALGLAAPLRKAARAEGWRVLVPDEAYLPIANYCADHVNAPGSQHAKLAQDLVAQGKTEGWVWVRTWQELQSTPPLAVPPLRTGQEQAARFEDLVRAPLTRALHYATATIEEPRRQHLAVDFYAAYGLTEASAIQLLAWPNHAAFLEVVQQLRSARASTLGLPRFVRILAERGHLPPHQRRRVLAQLARSGFGDALHANDLLDLAKGAPNLATLEEELDGLEGMVGHPNGQIGIEARLMLASHYAQAIVSAFLGKEEEGDDGRDVAAPRRMPGLGETMPIPQRQVHWSIDDAKLLLGTLLARVESLARTHRVCRGLLVNTLAWVGMAALSRFRQAFPLDAENPNNEVIDGTTDFGKMWATVAEWAGDSGARRDSLGLALRESWVVLSKKREASSEAITAALMVAETDGDRHEAASLVHRPELETVAILSANWSNRPLRNVGLLVIPDPNRPSVKVTFEEMLENGAKQLSESSPRQLPARNLNVLMAIPGHEQQWRTTIPVEAAVLRLEPSRAQPWLVELQRAHGHFDRRAYQLLQALIEAPADASKRVEYAQYTVTAPWRLIRDDPSFLLSWPHHLPVTGDMPICLERLCELLHEPTTPLGEEEPTALLKRRMKDTWAALTEETKGKLFVNSTCVPGATAANLVGASLPQLPELAFQALRRIEDSDAYPISIVVGDILLLRVALALQPVLDVGGVTTDLRDVVAPLLARVLSREMPTKRRHDAFASYEMDVLQASASVVRTLLATSPAERFRGTSRDWLWLSYRLHSWMCDQLLDISPDARLAGFTRLRAANAAEKKANPEPPNIDDIFNPLLFEQRGFDFRLANILFALGMMEELASGDFLERELPKDSSASVSTAELETMLLELAGGTRPESTQTTSWFEWRAPGNVPDLALEVLLRLHPERIFDLPEQTIVDCLHRWPGSSEGEGKIDAALTSRVLFTLAQHAERMSEELKTMLETKLLALEEQEEEQPTIRTLGLSALFAAGRDSLREAVRASLDEVFTQDGALIVVSNYLHGYARSANADLEAEVISIFEGAEQADPAQRAKVISLAVARLAIQAEGETAQQAGQLLFALAERPVFRDDEQLRQLVKLVGRRGEESST